MIHFEHRDAERNVLIAIRIRLTSPFSSVRNQCEPHGSRIFIPIDRYSSQKRRTGEKFRALKSKNVVLASYRALEWLHQVAEASDRIDSKHLVRRCRPSRVVLVGSGEVEAHANGKRTSNSFVVRIRHDRGTTGQKPTGTVVWTCVLARSQFLCSLWQDIIRQTVPFFSVETTATTPFDLTTIIEPNFFSRTIQGTNRKWRIREMSCPA